jgi:hypothetical protein
LNCRRVDVHWAGARPAAPQLASTSQIGPQLHRQSAPQNAVRSFGGACKQNSWQASEQVRDVGPSEFPGPEHRRVLIGENTEGNYQWPLVNSPFQHYKEEFDARPRHRDRE